MTDPTAERPEDGLEEDDDVGPVSYLIIHRNTGVVVKKTHEREEGWDHRFRHVEVSEDIYKAADRGSVYTRVGVRRVLIVPNQGQAPGARIKKVRLFPVHEGA